MRFVIDCTICDGRISGIERYSMEVGERLAESQADAGWEVILLTAKDASWPPPSVRRNGVKVLQSSHRSKLLTQQAWIPYCIGRLRPDAVFFPGFPPSPLVFAVAGRKTRVVRTIHDVAMWCLPETVSVKNKLYYRPLEAFGSRRYSLVFTVSGHSKEEIEKCLPWLKGKVAISGCGVSRAPVPGDAPVPNLVGGEYLLFVGTLEPRKNLIFLLRVFEKVLALKPSLKLVLAGRFGWGAREVLSVREGLGLSSSVVVTGPVSDETLWRLYANALVFVYPSLYEGFGIPVAEALSYGVPVLSSNATSLPEVCGSAAILLEPDDHEGWLRSIIRLVDSPELRRQMSEAGKVRAQQFTWPNVARRIAAAMT